MYVLLAELENHLMISIFFVFQWGQNLTLLYDRVLRYPDRVRNLYFTFLFVLRAVTKVSFSLSESSEKGVNGLRINHS